MPKDPLRIFGKKSPTPEERAQAEALAQQTGRPAKMCRAALLESDHDVARATKLRDDPDFIRMNTDFDIGAIARLGADSPLAALESIMGAIATHSGKSEAEVGEQFKVAKEALQQDDLDRLRRMSSEQRVQEAKGTKLTDPMLGELTWDYFWEGEIDVPGFGLMQLRVDSGDDPFNVAIPPTEAHRTTCQQFLSVAERLRADVEQANWEYFQQVRPGYVEAFGDRVPDVKSAPDLWNELEGPPALFIPEQTGKSWRVRLAWNCTWDQEHGHEVFIEGGKVVYVDIQGGHSPD